MLEPFDAASWVDRLVAALRGPDPRARRGRSGPRPAGPAATAARRLRHPRCAHRPDRRLWSPTATPSPYFCRRRDPAPAPGRRTDRRGTHRGPGPGGGPARPDLAHCARVSASCSSSRRASAGIGWQELERSAGGGAPRSATPASAGTFDMPSAAQAGMQLPADEAQFARPGAIEIAGPAQTESGPGRGRRTGVTDVSMDQRPSWPRRPTYGRS